MTYVGTENCIRCQYMDCVEVCPVDCFYAGENMLVINPSECIDCGVCEPECPAKAIVPASDDCASPWAATNATHAEQSPRITRNGDPPTAPAAWRRKSPNAKPLPPHPPPPHPTASPPP